jgi:4-amino-4-deoxy-L-arabinose transferase-like glycosyltransferase
MVVGAGLLVGAIALVVVHLLLHDTYWEYSEGVYALSSHQLLHGSALYTEMVGAQPPGVFLLGTGLLAIHDGLEWLRLGVACLQLIAGLIGAQIVLRITGSRVAAVITAAAILLTPWAVREHGALTPELVGLPLLLGAALLSGGDGRAGREVWRAVLAGVLCGALPLVKLPLAIAAVVLIALSADPRRTGTAALLTLAVGLGTTTLIAGGSFWRDVVVAQTQTGSRSLSQLGGYWAQAGWNLLGLIVCAGVAVRYRRIADDPRLLRTSVGLAAATFVTFLSNLKIGTSLNIAVPVEAALVPLAISGIVFAVRAPGPRWIGAIAVLALAFTFSQTVSLVASPHNPEPFLRPGSSPAWEIAMTSEQLHAAVKAARACPPRVPFSGPPLIAFVAGRSMPAGQPDQYLVTHARTVASVKARVAAAGRLCP